MISGASTSTTQREGSQRASASSSLRERGRGMFGLPLERSFKGLKNSEWVTINPLNQKRRCTGMVITYLLPDPLPILSYTQARGYALTGLSPFLPPQFAEFWRVLIRHV